MSNQDARSIAFEVGGVSVTVRPLRTGADKIFRTIVLRKVRDALATLGAEWADLADRAIVEVYADAVVLSHSTGHTLPAIGATADQHAEGFIAWLNLPSELVDRWVNAITTVNTPPNDPALLPPTKITAEKKANTPESAPVSKSA